MANNFWCPKHMDENIEHRKECLLCTVKGEVVSNEETLVCPMTQVLLKKMGEVMNGGYLKMSGMTSQQRGEVLKKRSRAHFQKEIKEQKNDMLKKSGMSGV